MGDNSPLDLSGVRRWTYHIKRPVPSINSRKTYQSINLY